MAMPPGACVAVSRLAVLVALLVVAGCASTPPEPAAPGEALPGSASVPGRPPAVEPHADAGLQLVEIATAQLGRPYRRGGADPDGFDCSGLVLYAHRALGLRVPRTAAEQNAAATPVDREALRAGDLVFFRVGGGAIDHVGIYAGQGAFVHAPGAGRGVERVRLDHPWFARRFAGAGRFWRGADTLPATP